MSPDKASSIYLSNGVCVKPKAWKLTHKDLRQSESRFATASGNLPVPLKPNLACCTTFLRKAHSKSRHFDVGSLQLHLSSELVCPTDDILKLKARLIRQLRVCFICAIFRLDKNSLHQGLEKLSVLLGLQFFLLAFYFAFELINQYLKLHSPLISERINNQLRSSKSSDLNGLADLIGRDHPVIDVKEERNSFCVDLLNSGTHYGSTCGHLNYVRKTTIQNIPVDW